MPIINLQRRQTEVGRIRIGQQIIGSNGKSRPVKLDKFRITTASRRIADQVAALYGGEVKPWKSPAGSQWEVLTEAKSLPVVIPPQDPITQWMELWSGGGCQRRCDGLRNVLTDSPCACPEDPHERADLAAKGNACKPTTRLNVMLAEVPSIGVFRLESHGFYAAVELPGVADVLASAGGYIEGRLELQQRTVKRPKANGGGVETRQYMVPVLDVNVAPAKLVELNAGRDATAAVTAAGEQHTAISAAPLAEPVDWPARIAAVADEASWRALRAEIAGGGELTPELEQALRDRATAIKTAGQHTPAADSEPVDAEIVEDGPEPDAQQVWQQIQAAAGANGWTASETTKRFREHSGGVDLPDATGRQFAAFLTHIQGGGR